MVTVRLREVVEGDRERLLAWRNSPDVSAYMYSDHKIGHEEHDHWFDVARHDPRRRYWVIEADGEPVGLANLADIDFAHRRCAWAYYLASPKVRGLGVGSFVEFQIIEYVFGQLGLNKLWCEVLISNESVWRLHELYGFQREALFRQHVMKQGHEVDVVGLGLLSCDWAVRREAMAERLRGKGFEIPSQVHQAA
ncbi:MULTISPECIES: UDP-4-amino-4,6-dideoxy-N-acetyl-beta-L-altrosamine N-acetyltransferase [unclassified Caulobacter]|uniref:UDP-4-amino-4, 6-dideoxy-N-acetyl-beta-L-altrosamine N-acetyltransferase n=1 Tax=unclassified Caulobacter TaxID=2648921 RepID=UPI0007847F89|nr:MULTISPECIES: UDP-4-amino-4,6-dideoxy-N-acetyl-beta-L-altrosamine N-acetyltransferase [unclassified Caulobacter]AZS23431.1 UDP-4-amino-4,6-dideoxy-N-acetyl-beta-L-altrosamine N-acetyltransferase [Caulobacter sp. FWC26]